MPRRKYTTYDRPKGTTLSGFSKDKKETPIWTLYTPKQRKGLMNQIFGRTKSSERLNAILKIRKK